MDFVVSGSAGTSGEAGAVCLGLKSLSRRALDTTLTELRLMAAAPNMGESCQPRMGKKTPAARGMPMEL